MTRRLAFGIFFSAFLLAQQVPDPNFRPTIANPAYLPSQGPVVYLDEAHHNFHTLLGRYAPFAALLSQDGYRPQSLAVPFSAESLAPARILVIANPLHASNISEWRLPTPSAFTPEEINAVSTWVNGGGSLLLIADHMPFAGAASDLAAAFGIHFANGFARSQTGKTPDVFTPKAHDVTQGIPSLATFTGSCFKIEGSHAPLLVLGPGFVSLEPEQAWVFNDKTLRRNVEGWLQGAVLPRGKGRIAVFGEAAMFTAQLAGPNKNPMGMNHPQAPHNARFLLQLFHWLTPKP